MNIDILKIKSFSLIELITYQEALSLVINKYEACMTPLYGMASEFDWRWRNDKENINKVIELKAYLSCVLQVIEEKTLEELQTGKVNVGDYVVKGEEIDIIKKVGELASINKDNNAPTKSTTKKGRKISTAKKKTNASKS